MWNHLSFIIAFSCGEARGRVLPSPRQIRHRKYFRAFMYWDEFTVATWKFHGHLKSTVNKFFLGDGCVNFFVDIQRILDFVSDIDDFSLTCHYLELIQTKTFTSSEDNKNLSIFARYVSLIKLLNLYSTLILYVKKQIVIVRVLCIKHTKMSFSKTIAYSKIKPVVLKSA